MKRICLVLAIAAASTSFAAEAMASCFPTTASRARLVVAPKLLFDARTSAASADEGTAGTYDSIVGLWKVSFLAGDGPNVAYEGFQQWHTGGTEVMVDNGVPPSLGNVCVGVWKQAGIRTYKLRHVTFNWDGNGKPAGTFVMLMTVRIDRSGNAYTGSYTADSFDLSGNVIPELHLEGRARGTRITVD